MDFLDLVRTFVQVAEGGSLSRAARTLRLSLPAVSRRIGTLENNH
jgi:DNA-binding transcriptional LysR family regulator